MTSLLSRYSVKGVTVAVACTDPLIISSVACTDSRISGSIAIAKLLKD
jgi:hypothetical protein